MKSKEGGGLRTRLWGPGNEASKESGGGGGGGGGGGWGWEGGGLGTRLVRRAGGAGNEASPHCVNFPQQHPHKWWYSL